MSVERSVWRRPGLVREYRWRCGKRSGLWHDNEAGAGEPRCAPAGDVGGEHLYLGRWSDEARIAPSRKRRR